MLRSPLPQAGAAGRDVADVAARRGATLEGGRLAFLAVRVAAAVRVVDRVLRDAADAREELPGAAVRVVDLAGLRERLVAAAAAGGDADGRAAGRVELLELA